MAPSLFGTSVMEDNLPMDGAEGWFRDVSHKEHIPPSLKCTVHRRLGAPVRLQWSRGSDREVELRQ